MLLPGLPVNARLKIVRSGVVFANAAAHAGCTFASGQCKNPVPITTALAPKVSAAATPRPSAIPPAATTGIRTASTIAGTSAINPTSSCSAFLASNAPRCPPASIPCAMITSAPAASAFFASTTVVAVANHGIRRDFNSETNDDGYKPMIDETAADAIRSKAWNWSSKFGRAISPASSGTGGPQRDKIRERALRASDHAPAVDLGSQD